MSSQDVRNAPIAMGRNEKSVLVYQPRGSQKVCNASNAMNRNEPSTVVYQLMSSQDL